MLMFQEEKIFFFYSHFRFLFIYRSYGTHIRIREINIRSMMFLSSGCIKCVDIIEPYHPERYYDSSIRFKLYLLHRSRHLLLEKGTMCCSIDYPTPVLITSERGGEVMYYRKRKGACQWWMHWRRWMSTLTGIIIYLILSFKIRRTGLQALLAVHLPRMSHPVKNIFNLKCSFIDIFYFFYVVYLSCATDLRTRFKGEWDIIMYIACTVRCTIWNMHWKVAKKESRCTIVILQTHMVGEHVDPEMIRILCTVYSKDVELLISFL